MEPTLNKEKIFRPSYIDSAEPSQKTGPVSVEDLKTDLSAEFSSVSTRSDTSQRSSLEPKGHIQVCLRVRPLTTLEKQNELQDCVSLEDSTSIKVKPPKTSLSQLNAGQLIQKFSFSQVFGPETTQEEFFEGTMKQPVQDFLCGYNRLIFTYGVTNAGKTYTFQGTEGDVGILPRTMDMLFKTLEGKLYTGMDLKPHRCRDYTKLTKEQVREETAIKYTLLRQTKEADCHSSTDNKAPADSKDLEEPFEDLERSNPAMKNYITFSVWVSFFEIYNECFYDLLVPVSNDKKRKPLRLAQDIKGCSYVKGVQWVQISDSKEAFRLLKLGLKHQSTASTKLNTCSSRSHSIFTVKILKIEDVGAPQVIQVNELSMCDLAGSERYTKTCNKGDRLKESGNINTSLLALGKCVKALKNCQQSKLQLHIPFRESKLTHYLQAYFTGKGKVYMIVNISQCASAYDETLNVLRFSALAQEVLVMDTSVLPQDQSFGQKLAEQSSQPSCCIKPVPRRATIHWDRTLEDVIEDDDEMEEQHDRSTEEVQKHEENKVLIEKDVYMRLLSLIEELKDQLITEKKNKLLLELKIREEVTQEFQQYFAEQEMDFKRCLSHERERLEYNSEKRLEIFKELVNSSPENTDEGNKLKDQPCSEQAGPLDESYSTGPGTHIDIEGIIDSLQNDIIDIKKQAEEAHKYIVSLENPEEIIDLLEKQLAKITIELIKTKEELRKKTNEVIETEEKLTQKNKDFEMQRIEQDECAEHLKEATKKMNTQNERIQELLDIVEQKDDVIAKLQKLISQLEETIKDYDNTIATIKKNMVEKNCNQVTENHSKDCEKALVEMGRKRSFKSMHAVEEEPPAKKALQGKSADFDNKLKELNDQEANLSEEVLQLMTSLENMKHCLQEKEKNEDEQIQCIALLRKDLSESAALVQSLQKDLQRKEEENLDLKEKFSDAKKQIQQVQREVCTMRFEEKSLRRKVNELEKMNNKFSEELEMKERTILQLKMELSNNEKLEELSKQYEETCKELCTKHKIIEDMQMTLKEQEQTQTEQEQVIDANLEENHRLAHELEIWKQKYKQLNSQMIQNEEVIKLQEELQENEAKYQTDRKKWLEEKMGFLSQVKEAESHRNREMKKFAVDRERHAEQRAEIEKLAAQLVEKDTNLQKWREERDKLVEALEIQLKTLTSNIVQKDKEIAELKEAALKEPGKDKESDAEELRKQLAEKDDLIKELKQRIIHENRHSLTEVPLSEGGQDNIDQSISKEDSTMVQVDKPKKKRKSEELDEDLEKSEKKKAAGGFAVNLSLRNKRKKFK